MFPSTETEASRDGTDMTCAALNCKSPPPDWGGAVSPGKGTSFHAVLNCKSPPLDEGVPFQSRGLYVSFLFSSSYKYGVKWTN